MTIAEGVMTPKKELGIKESLEAVAALEIVAVSGVQMVKAKGMAERLSVGLELVKSSEKVVEGVKGIDQVDDEIKDLSQEELVQLGLATFSMIKKVAAAAKSEVA